MKPVVYRVPRAIVVPVLLGMFAVFIAAVSSLWALLALPFILLGSLCAAPNMNLANGFLVMVSIALALVVGHFQSQAGGAIFAGVVASWFFSSIEKRLRARPVYEPGSSA